MLTRRCVRLPRLPARGAFKGYFFVRYWISYRTRDLDGASDTLEQNETALGAYTRATALTQAGEFKVKIRDGDTFQSWGVEAFAASHGLIEPPGD